MDTKCTALVIISSPGENASSFPYFIKYALRLLAAEIARFHLKIYAYASIAIAGQNLEISLLIFLNLSNKIINNFVLKF